MVFFHWSLFLGKDDLWKSTARCVCFFGPFQFLHRFASAHVTLRCQCVKAIFRYLSRTDCIRSLGPSRQNSRHVKPRQTKTTTAAHFKEPFSLMNPSSYWHVHQSKYSRTQILSPRTNFIIKNYS